MVTFGWALGELVVLCCGEGVLLRAAYALCVCVCARNIYVIMYLLTFLYIFASMNLQNFGCVYLGL